MTKFIFVIKFIFVLWSSFDKHDNAPTLSVIALVHTALLFLDLRFLYPIEDSWFSVFFFLSRFFIVCWLIVYTINLLTIQLVFRWASVVVPFPFKLFFIYYYIFWLGDLTNLDHLPNPLSQRKVHRLFSWARASEVKEFIMTKWRFVLKKKKKIDLSSDILKKVGELKVMIWLIIEYCTFKISQMMRIKKKKKKSVERKFH